jgi:hypothetical protein
MLQEPAFLTSPSLDQMVGIRQEAAWPTINPTIFAPMDANELDNIHAFVCRCLSDILATHSTIANITSQYFNSVNTWFTVVPQTDFAQRVAETRTAPSAEVGILILCMLLSVRLPNDNPLVGMGDSLYLSIKSLLGVVQVRVPLSISLLQAELLISLYEQSHCMPQQAYMSVGRCFQMTKAFGWHHKGFWAKESWNIHARDLKLCSILWWATVYMDR